MCVQGWSGCVCVDREHNRARCRGGNEGRRGVVTYKGHVTPLNECTRLHVKVRSIILVQLCAECGGALVRARAHGRSTLECTAK
jgi:hypothetical protein